MSGLSMGCFISSDLTACSICGLNSSLATKWKGKIIAFEGMDASGKATQTKRLAKALGGKVIDFPHYQTPVGQLIKSHLMKDWVAATKYETEVGDHGWKRHDGDAMVFQCLQTINRLEMMPEIYDLLNQGTPVVFDRYWASAIVYGSLDGLDINWIKKIQAPLPEPDIWFFLDIPAEESVRRRPERRDRYEKQPGLMEKVRERYLALFKEEAHLAKIALSEIGQEKASWHIIDAIGTEEEVHQRILKALV